MGRAVLRGWGGVGWAAGGARRKVHPPLGWSGCTSTGPRPTGRSFLREEPRPTGASDPAVILAAMNPTILRRVQKVLLTLGMVVTAMCLVLIVACFRNDAEIEKHKATVTADVVYADRLHANAYFQTPDGSVHSPRLGLLYPTAVSYTHLTLPTKRIV